MPSLSKLFASNDRSVRRSLLESIDSYGPHLTEVRPSSICPLTSSGCTCRCTCSLAAAHMLPKHLPADSPLACSFCTHVPLQACREQPTAASSAADCITLPVDMVVRWSQSAVEEQIYPHVATGFTDSNAYLRELTLKSMLVLGPKLSQRTLNQSLLKFLAKLQVLPCRTSATLGPILSSPVSASPMSSKVLGPCVAVGVSFSF